MAADAVAPPAVLQPVCCVFRSVIVPVDDATPSNAMINHRHPAQHDLENREGSHTTPGCSRGLLEGDPLRSPEARSRFWLGTRPDMRLLVLLGDAAQLPSCRTA